MGKVLRIAMFVCTLVATLVKGPTRPALRRQCMTVFTAMLILALLFTAIPLQTRAMAPRERIVPSTLAGTTGRTAVNTYAKQPLRFELNQGQTDRQVSFLSRSHGSRVFLTSTEALSTQPSAPKTLTAPKPPGVIAGPQPSPGRTTGRVSVSAAPAPQKLPSSAVRGRSLASPLSTCTADLLVDSSFEYADYTDWVRGNLPGATSFTIYSDRTRAVEGSGYMEMNTVQPQASVIQTVAVTPSVGDSYVFSIWVRSPEVAPSPVPFSGSITITGNGGTVETGTQNFVAGQSWTLVSVPLSIQQSGHTSLTAAIVMGTTNHNLDVDGAQLINAGLTDASFENSTTSGWAVGPTPPGTNFAVYADATRSKEGAGFAEMNTPTSGGTVAQAVSSSPSVGQSYVASVWVRSPEAGVAFKGTLTLYGIGGTTESSSTAFTAGPNWTLVSAPLDVQQSGHTSLQVEIGMTTTGHNLDVDGAQLVNACMTDASWETPTFSPPWMKSQLPNSSKIASYVDSTYSKEGPGYGEASTTAAGASFVQFIPVAPTVGQSYVGSIWVRSKDGTPFSGTLATWGLGGTNESGNTNFVAGSTWTLVTAALNVQQSGHTQMALEVYMTTTNHNLDVDAASLANGNAAGLLPPGQVPNVSASAGNGQATVSWPAPPPTVGGPVSSYTVTPYVGTVAQTPMTVSGTTTSTTVTGLNNGTAYSFQLTAANASGSGPVATSNGVVTPTGPPDPPASASALASDGRAQVSWSAPRGNGGSAVTGYVITPFIGTTAQTAVSAGASATTVSVLNLTNNTPYTFHVAAQNSAGTGQAAVTLPVTPAQVAPLITAPANIYPVHSTPMGVAAGDVNGDGIPDIVTANGNQGNISLLLGKPDGTYQPAIDISIPGAVNAVALGDFNGDGKLDIAFAANANNQGQFGVMLGHGDGTFSAPVMYSTHGAAPSLVLADMNGDGKLDAVLADSFPPNADPATVSVFLGNGDGTFQSERTSTIGGTYAIAQSVAVADLNGDGKLDIVVANMGGCGFERGDVLVLLGNGDGSFQSAQSLGDTCPNSVTIADLNHDGVPDIISTNPNGVYNSQDQIRVYYGRGDGTFSSPATFAVAANSRPGAVTTADLNGDHNLDVVVSESSGTTQVLLGMGNGNLAAPISLGPGGYGTAVADLNRDGLLDLAVGGPGANVSVLLNGTSFPPLGGPLTPAELLGNTNFCFSCASKHNIHGIGGDPVDTATGNFSETATDIGIPGRAPLHLTRTYNSAAAGTFGALGYGWSLGVGASLVQNADGSVTVSQENGSQVTFLKTGSTYTPSAPRDIATLVHNADSTWTFTRLAQQRLTFSPSGQLSGVAYDLNGPSTTLSLTYTGNLLAKITDPAGRYLQLTYTGLLITAVQDSSGRHVSYGYDGNGNLTDFTDLSGNTFTHYTYDTGHRLKTMRDPRLNTVTNDYDASGRVDWQLDQMGRKTTFTYLTDSATGLPATVVTTPPTADFPSGTQTYQVYAYGVKILETRGYGTAQAATWRYTHDPVTLGMLMVIDPNGNVRSARYDSSGNQLTSKDALGRTTTNTYNSLNELLTTTDPLNVITTMTYDAAGNMKTRSRPLIGTNQTQLITYHYNDLKHPGDVTSITDAKGKTWHLKYDIYGDLTISIDPLGDKATSTFNTIGWLLKQVSPKGYLTGNTPSQYTTTFVYDNAGRVKTTKDPLGHVTKRHYDPDGNLDTFTDASGKVTKYTYDAANRLTIVTRPDKTTLVTDYNPDGTMLDQKDGNGQATTYGYDPLARVTSITDPLKRTTSAIYDGAGNRLTVTDPQSQTTTFGYDAANQLTSVTYSDGITPNVTNIQYDNDGQRRAMTDGTGSSSWSWDSLHRLTQSKDGSGNLVSYGYDLKSQLTSILYPGQSTPVQRAFDDAGRLHTVTDWLGNTTTFNPDANSNPGTIVFPNGTNITDTYTFNTADQLMGISDSKNGSTFASFTYSRDNNGQLTQDTPTGVPNSTQDYGYNILNQLCYAASGTGTCATPPVGATTYAHDKADNLTRIGSSSLAYDGANQLCWTLPTVSTNTCGTAPSGATTYSYDKRGNRTLITPPSGAPTALTYDQANRLTAYGSSATYVYNGDGLRVKKVVSGTTYGMVWNVAQGLPLLMQDGTAAYIYGMGGQLLERISGNTVAYYHTDQLGSVRAMTDSSGNVLNTYSYDTYGNVTGSTGTLPNAFKFAGEYQDSESGMYYLRARYYEPSTGQFISRDPLVAATRSAYAYVAGNPLNATDPTGLDCSLNPLDSNSCISNVFHHPDTAAGVVVQGIAGQAGIHADLTPDQLSKVGRVMIGGGVAAAGAACVWTGVCEAVGGVVGGVEVGAAAARWVIATSVIGALVGKMVGNPNQGRGELPKGLLPFGPTPQTPMPSGSPGSTPCPSPSQVYGPPVVPTPASSAP